MTMETIFQPIVDLFALVLNLLYEVTHSYGGAIILLTVLIKIAMYPLSRKQFESMKAMQKMQPELKRLQEKYRDKPQILQQKMMELYSRAGANPLSGCLPMLLQMPILMAMYYALYSFDYGGRAQSFLWLESLSAPDALYILPVLSALTTYLQQKISSVEMNQQMRVMMVVMPLFILWISLNFPAGLVLYWVTMNAVQIIQQLWIKRQEPAA